MTALRPWLYLATLVSPAALLAGCGDSAGARRIPPPPTLIAVRPEDFLGDVACMNAPGAMRSYVATLTDVTGGDAGPGLDFELPSSGPVPCWQTVTFGFVVPGHQYVARVQGFDRTDISPLGGAASGSPIMVDESGTVVTPRWTTTCGRSSEEPGAQADATGSPATSVQFVTVPVLGCDPLEDDAPQPGETAISVDVLSALGTLSCGDEAGDVSRFSAQLEGRTEPPLDAACGTPVVFTELTAGQQYDFDLLAFEAGAGEPGWSSECFQIAVRGVRRPASCDPLSDRGSLTLATKSVLASVGTVCDSTGYPRSRAVLTSPALGGSVTAGPARCDEPFVFRDLAAGIYEVVLTTTLADQSAGPSAFCEHTLFAGEDAVATCTATPPAK